MEIRNVVFACFPQMQALDVVGPNEVFAAATRIIEHRRLLAPRYRIHLGAQTPGDCVTESGLVLRVGPLPRLRAIDTLLVPGGDGVLAARDDQTFVRWVKRNAADARRVGSVCSGTFVLAEAGLLDGLRVTTHWRRVRQLTAEYPSLTVDSDPIYIRNDRIWTSAGVTSGIDMALAMVEDDLGAEVAQLIARSLVMFLRRPGGQSQFAPPLWTQPVENDAVRAAQERIAAAPADDHRVDVLAHAVDMSTRHFTRVFTEEVGESPARYVEQVRVSHARNLLESTSLTIAVIANRCGFGTDETMRRAFVRRVGVSPDDYRKRFTR